MGGVCRRQARVLLIDEIDKADIEFPNDLLQELDRMEFHVYETGETVTARQRPMVIITSNNEKELPDAFLRRCFFHYIRFPGHGGRWKNRRGPLPRHQRRLLTSRADPVLSTSAKHGAEEKASHLRSAGLAEAVLAEDLTAEDLRGDARRPARNCMVHC